MKKNKTKIVKINKDYSLSLTLSKEYLHTTLQFIDTKEDYDRVISYSYTEKNFISSYYTFMKTFYSAFSLSDKNIFSEKEKEKIINFIHDFFCEDNFKRTDKNHIREADEEDIEIMFKLFKKLYYFMNYKEFIKHAYEFLEKFQLYAIVDYEKDNRNENKTYIISIKNSKIEYEFILEEEKHTIECHLISMKKIK